MSPSIRFGCLALAVVGLVLALLLAIPYFAGDAQHALPGFCGSEHCDHHLQSPWAWFPPALPEFGPFPIRLPIAILGLWHFFALAAWFGLVGLPSLDRRLAFVLPLVESTVGCVASSGLLGVMLVTGHWCLLCITTHLVNILLGACVYLGWMALGRTESVPERVPYPSLPRLTLVLLLSGGAGIVLLPAGLTAEVEFTKLVEQHLQQGVGIIPVDADDPRLPAQQEPAHRLVIFTDLECPPCRDLNERLDDTILPLYGGRLEVIWKHFPLCTDCNPFRAQVHPQACERAWLAEAARMQGGMDVFRAVQFHLERRTTPLTPADVESLARQVGLDPVRLERDHQGPEVRARVTRHVQAGFVLDVRGTPTVFLDGKLVHPLLVRHKAFWEMMSKR